MTLPDHSHRLRIIQVDAFTTRAYGGNPCAVVLDAEGLTEAAMQTIAREMNLSETAFVLASDRADVRARYFTPTMEIPLAGHPTIATIHVLLDEGRLPAGDHITVSLELQAGVIPVAVHKESSGRHRIVMSQKRPEFLREYDRAACCPRSAWRRRTVCPAVP